MSDHEQEELCRSQSSIACPPDVAIRELERLKQREIDERPEDDDLGAAHVDLAILALEYAIQCVRQFPTVIP